MKKNYTKNGDFIETQHLYDLPTIKKNSSPDITVWVKINKKNSLQICQRIVVLEFLYARDTYDLVFHWTRKKHDEIAGPDWPPFSTTITDYPTWCLNELCQVAYNRCCLWEKSNDDFDFQIDSDELFGNSEPNSIRSWLDSIGCELDLEFLNTWKTLQQELFAKYQCLFTWQPGNNDYMIMLEPNPAQGVW